MTQAQSTPEFHPTALKVLVAVQATEARATNHLEWIAEEAGVPDSTASRWLRRLEDLNLIKRYKQDWIWKDPHVYYRMTEFGERVLAAQNMEDVQCSGAAVETQIREVVSEAQRLCACGHSAHWHGDVGRGSCEHDGECGCKRFVRREAIPSGRVPR